MPDFDFSQPQRQSEVGLILIFGTSLYQLTRSLWVLGVYFLVGDVNTKTLLFAIFGAVVVLLLTLGYSILYYLNFKFYIDEKNREFVLQKGVFSSDVLNIPFEKIQQVNFKRNILQRVIGVYSVVVETAGSQEKEVEIKALSREKANELADQLMSLAKKHDGLVDNTETEESSEEVTSIKGTPEWEHHVGLITLVKLGLT
ncbi:PH domain-containing protein, partial [Longispora fulva]|uniref:PH domain-containing protein n=2 Tax=Bacteria TaxID=2 RepID=UPI003631AC95